MTLKPLLSLAIATLLVGCGQLKVRPVPSDFPANARNAQLAASGDWTEPALVREGSPMLVLATPMTPPETILRRQIKLELETGAKIRDVVTVLANLGYSIIIADRDAANADVLAPRYHGTLGGLLASLQRAADVWFSWENSALVVSSRERIVMSLPQERKLADRIAVGLQNLGLCMRTNAERGVAERSLGSDGGSSGYDSKKSSTASQSEAEGTGGETGGCGAEKGAVSGAAAWEAGMVSLVVRPSELQRAALFLERMTQNAAIVNLQVAMVSVTTNQNVSRGIDWTKLQLAAGGEHPNLIDQLRPKETQTGTGGGEGEEIPTTTTPTLPFTGTGALLSGGAIRGVISNSAFSMIGFLEFMESYGATKTLQNVMLRTVTGNEVELKSLTQIPYVSGVGIGSTGITSGGVSNNGVTIGQAETEVANDGIILNLLPSYDAASQSVTIDMALSIEAVLGFNELSAGNQLGKLTQPTTAKRTFNDVIRVRPGQTVVVGGIAYDQIQRDNNVPLYLPNQAGRSALKVKRESMFIVLRPTVLVLGSLEINGTQLLEPAVDHKDKPRGDTSDKPARGAAE